MFGIHLYPPFLFLSLFCLISNVLHQKTDHVNLVLNVSLRDHVVVNLHFMSI